MGKEKVVVKFRSREDLLSKAAADHITTEIMNEVYLLLTEIPDERVGSIMIEAWEKASSQY